MYLQESIRCPHHIFCALLELEIQNLDLCHFCNKGILPEEGTILLQTTDCYHSVHLECFKDAAKAALRTNTELFCP